MSDFITSQSADISIGTTAVALPSVAQPVAGDLSGNSPHQSHRRSAPQIRIANTHATQTLYFNKNGTATSADEAIAAGQSRIFNMPAPEDAPTLLGSGASTTGTLEVGSVN